MCSMCDVLILVLNIQGRGPPCTALATRMALSNPLRGASYKRHKLIFGGRHAATLKSHQ